MKNLYLFPCLPDSFSGYGIAVASDLKLLNCSFEDYYVFISDSKNSILPFPNSLLIYRNNLFFRVFNVFSTGHPSFFCSLYVSILIFLKFKEFRFNTLFIGDINFFGVQKYFKFINLKLRLHNVYLKIRDNLRTFSISREYVKLFYEVTIGSIVENNMVNYAKNHNIEIFCISEQERDYLKEKFNLNVGLLKVILNIKKIKPSYFNDEFYWDNRIVWFGGLSSHKLLSMKYFIKNIFPQLKNSNENLRFELFGKGTDKLSNSYLNIKGHGFVDQFDFEKFSNSIFINPDLVGGGVKLKLLSLSDHKLFCLTTQLGFEGFCIEDLGDRFIVADISKWSSVLSNINNFRLNN